MSDDRSGNITIARAAAAVGVIAAVLVLIMCALLTATHLQLKKADPLNSELLESMRDRYAGGETTDELRQQVRQLDLLSRKAFFTSQRQVVAGGAIAVAAGVVMLIAFGLYHVMMTRVPAPGGGNCEGIFWDEIHRSRAWILGGAGLLVVLSVVMTLSTPTVLTEDLLEAAPDPIPIDTDPVVPTDPSVPVYPKDFAANAPVFRGAAGSGLTDFDAVPTDWDETEASNVLWKTAINLPGWSSPVVWENKVVVMGADREKRAVYCLDTDSGDEVWKAEFEVEDKGYEIDTMDERWDLLMYAAATPAVNGKQVFAMFSEGKLNALDLKTGEKLWEVDLGATDENLFGLSGSLLIYRDSVLVVFQGNEKYIARYDARTGREIWKGERDGSTWASPILASADDDKHLIVLSADPDVTAWDAETGRQVWSVDLFTNEIEWCVGPTPVQIGSRVYVNMQNCGFFGLDLSDGKVIWRVDELPDQSSISDGPSMTTDGKYLYHYYQSVLTCIEAETGKVVKQQETDEYANYASPVANRSNLYLSSDGAVTVLDTDPESNFEFRGIGLINESSDSTPAIVEGRIYMRSDNGVYCIGINEKTRR